MKEIEDEEWRHRALVGEMLSEVGANPSRLREMKAWFIGHSLSFLCFVSGWFAPMYAAGKLESRNIREYELAARLALEAGCSEFVDCLLAMAEVEWEHEHYFRTQVLSHSFSQWIPVWPLPPPKENIRSSLIDFVVDFRRREARRN